MRQNVTKKIMKFLSKFKAVAVLRYVGIASDLQHRRFLMPLVAGLPSFGHYGLHGQFSQMFVSFLFIAITFFLLDVFNAEIKDFKDILLACCFLISGSRSQF